MKTYEQISEQMGTENEFPFEENEQSLTKTRAELEKMTNKELAKLAEPLQSQYSFNSLKGRSKPFLIDIILGVNKEPKINNNAKAAHKTTVNESEDIITTGLSVLQGIKQQREGQEALLNPIAQELFKNSAVNTVDKARAEGTLSSEKFSTALLALSGTALVVDSVIGFNNIPTYFTKLKARFTKKEEVQS
ncbi:hypothetical protein AMRN_1424 [Malaciobacter marinus]|uniref:Uncharacterized protein n=1 Tax=Malaciobacter marinus TaxID=505249 RepID=A0A347TKN2_9BACT|nr:hypothetical protein [Malaciobacter marinus]AXX87160.1 hypothetical protein AMRN_1424 [Malaciobacter marinus]PHO14823.1 hypothetical protein CPH92_09560 [Malaciobacter marinus]